MRSLPIASALSLLALLAGCVAPAPQQGPAGLLARCGADRLVPLIAGPVSALPAQPAGRTLRLIRPGDPVTEDFSDTRLNLILDAQDRITAVSCG